MRDILQGLAKIIDTNKTTLYYAIQFYRKFLAEYVDRAVPMLPEGKDLTWNKIITQ